MPIYQVKLHRDAERALRTLPHQIQSAAREVIDQVLHSTPLKRIPHKTKKLKGRLAGIIQYDLSRGYRLWYRVDQNSNTVYIIYVGPHP